MDWKYRIINLSRRALFFGNPVWGLIPDDGGRSIAFNWGNGSSVKWAAIICEKESIRRWRYVNVWFFSISMYVCTKTVFHSSIQLLPNKCSEERKALSGLTVITDKRTDKVIYRGFFAPNNSNDALDIILVNRKLVNIVYL